MSIGMAAIPYACQQRNNTKHNIHYTTRTKQQRQCYGVSNDAEKAEQRERRNAKRDHERERLISEDGAEPFAGIRFVLWLKRQIVWLVALEQRANHNEHDENDDEERRVFAAAQHALSHRHVFVVLFVVKVGKRYQHKRAEHDAAIQDYVITHMQTYSPIMSKYIK